MKNKSLIFGLLVGLLIIGLFYFSRNPVNFSGESNLNLSAVVYRTPNCSCCSNYISYLRRNGIKVEERKVSDQELENLKTEKKIPQNLWSCHTVFMNNYVVEGHVPIEAIQKLFQEKSQISGIALPEMPSGSPGMPGFKIAPFKIFTFTDSGRTELFLEI